MLQGGDTIALAKRISTLSLAKIEAGRRRRDDIEGELEALRASYRQIKEIVQEPGKQKELLASIVAKAAALKTELETIPTVHDLSSLRQHDEERVTDEVALLLCWVVEQINRKRTLSDEQIETLAVDLVHTYGYISMEDMALCFRNGVRGQYGELYDTIDVGVIHGWIGRYWQDLSADRMAAADSRRASAKEGRESRQSSSLRAFFYNTELNGIAVEKRPDFLKND